MKKILLRVGVVLIILALIIVFLPSFINVFMPEYKDELGNQSDDQKIQGMYLLTQSAKREDNVIIYGSSELRTDYISTHPANFFKDKRAGFQVNLVGRGSCQSIIHAMSIAASGDALKDSPVVLITSPQSYVEGGITPDMFFANFSKQQFLNIIYDKTIPSDIKTKFSKRVCEMFERYDDEFGKLSGYDDIRIIAKSYSDDTFYNKVINVVTYPYFMITKTLSVSKDMVKSAELINNCKTDTDSLLPIVDYSKEAVAAIEQAKKDSTNNDFGMRDSDYKKNVGNKLSKFKNRDKNLSYENSVEYDDLRLLLEICEIKGIKPLFVSVPLHGSWSDYTGFSKEKRQNYYEKVKKTVGEYDVELVDLSGYEYEEYFLCDTMHLGWKGWLKVNEEIDSFYKRHNK